MYALAGALVRNFVRARVITVNSVIDQSQHGRAPEATCLLIPNFFLGKADGGGLPAWQVAILYDVLLARSAQGLQTVVYVSSLDLMKKEYGFNFTRLIQTNYKTLEV